MNESAPMFRVMLSPKGLAVATLCAVGILVGFALGTGVAHASGGLEIVAHQDDDFLFMNPDVQNQISEGLQMVTVYMTAGESTGNAPDYCQTTPCPGRLALDRQKGIRAAYAQMDGLSPDAGGGYESYWSATLWQPDGVHWVERYTLQPDPRIELIFMNLHDQPDPPTYSLTNLLDDPAFVHHEDLIAIGNRTQSMADENDRALFL